MKGKIGALAFLVAMLTLSTVASGMGNTLTIHVRVVGDNSDTLVLQLEKIAEEKHFITAKITDADMALFQYHFAIAKAVKYIDLTVTAVGPGYFVVNIAKKDLKRIGIDNYVMKLPASVLKKNVVSTFLDQYKEADLLMVNVYANNKYLRTFVANMDVDIASVNLKEGYMTVFVSYKGLQALYLAGFDIEVVPTETGDVGILGLESEYHTYPEVDSELSQIQTDHSAIAMKFSLGNSYESRAIWGIKISDNVATEETEPEIFICGLHHARECATVEVCMYIVNYLTDHYGQTGYENVTSLVNNREIYIVPIVNPDGKVYDDSGGSSGSGRSWRKNRQPCSGGIGTDLNRNYSYQWGGSGSSGTCTSDTYRGTSAFSAPETAKVRDFFNAHPDINVLLTYHSYGALVLWPWGYTYDAIADANDRQVHEIMGNQYNTYVSYTAQQASDLYLASGTTDDWSYGVTQNDAMPCFSFTVELSGGEFYPPPSVLPTMCANNLQGALYFINCADNPYKVLPTPEPVEITNPSNGSTVSGTVNVTVDAVTQVTKVEFYIDSTLKSTDTASPFSWSWDTTAYSDASHTVMVKGYDASNALVDDDSVTVTVDNGGSCLGTFILSMILVFGSTAVSRRK